jgi:DNA polymerase
MTYRLWGDLETYSETPINHGTYRYAANAEITLFAWAIDEDPTQVWDLTAGEPMPYDLQVALRDPACEVWFHNSMFDRTVMRYALPEWCPPIERWRDSMVQAMCHSLPGKLATLCDVLGIAEDKAKSKRGGQLVQLLCKPRPATSKLRRATRDTHPAEWAEFVDYARLDVEAMREIHRKLPAWNYSGAELALWHLDQLINDRGITVDLDLANAALAAVEAEKLILAERTVDMTNGEVQTATQRTAMLEHMLTEYGVALPDLTMATVERRLDDPDIPEAMKELLRVRLQASTTSTSKYKALVRASNLDGRLRGLLQFAGAGRTARWSGRTFQPQNLPRPTLKDEAINEGIVALKAGTAGMIYTNVMEVASSAIRGCIVAPKGKKLVIADLSNIEGRGLAWLAGEEWKLQAFRDFDAGKGYDLYKLAYAKSFGIDPAKVTKDQRQVGKVQELALGYQGGVGAFVTFASAYGIDLDALAAGILPNAPENLLNEARRFIAWLKLQPKPEIYGLAEDTFIACDVVKRGWRTGHPAIAAWWPMLEQAFRDAIESPKYTFDCGTVKMRRDGSWLRVRLPSGRALCYPAPMIDDDNNCTYMGMNQYSRRWERLKTYAGKIAENCTQAFARDILAYNMPRIEAEGYQIVLSVHDELLTETPDSDEFNHTRLSELMSTVPPWAEGLPLAAAGFECLRYRKD